MGSTVPIFAKTDAGIEAWDFHVESIESLSCGIS